MLVEEINKLSNGERNIMDGIRLPSSAVTNPARTNGKVVLESTAQEHSNRAVICFTNETFSFPFGSGGGLCQYFKVLQVSQ